MPAENRRRIVAYSTATLATPISASGSRMLNGLSPKILIDSAMNHRLIGGLSTVIELAASEEPKKKAFQLTEPACAAAE